MSEKKYRLRWIDDRKRRPSYIAWLADDFAIYHGDSPIVEYSATELETLKKQVPRLAPAIEAMKEEVKDDD